jgi:hypothetical protein
MLLLNKKILTSGCGVSWSGQNKKTWVNILKTLGGNIEDVGGPAVSNQWVLDCAIDRITQSTDITHAIIQLTSLGKLDVEVDQERIDELVATDSLRNFTIQGVWPSSVSQEHQSKQLWNKWLSSPGLELQSVCCKLVLLSHWCLSHNIKLIVFQGYDLPWTNNQKSQLCGTLNFDVMAAVPEYQISDFYQWHDHAKQNTVPCLEFQFELAHRVSKQIDLVLYDRVEMARQQYFAKYHVG